MNTLSQAIKTSDSRGFTLIETMIVVLILAILVTLATPSYLGFLGRAHRVEAIGQLMNIAACQERVRASTGYYDTAKCLPRASDWYDFFYYPDQEAVHNYFQVAAQPLGSQSGDPCGELVLDSAGQRTIGDTSADLARCWSGR